MSEDGNEQIPQIYEISRVLEEMLGKFKSQEKIRNIVQILYEKYVTKKEAQDPYGPCSIQSLDRYLCYDKQFTATVVPQTFAFANEIQQILYFQKKISAQTFIRRGYSLQILRQELQKRGGLFDLTEYRYKEISIDLVTEGYRLAESYLTKDCCKIAQPLTKLETVCLYSILLNCRAFFKKNEVIAFLKMVALRYEEKGTEINIRQQDLISFYEHAKRLIEFKLEKGRSAFKLHFTKNKQDNSKQILDPNLQKELREDKILEIYMNYQKISETKEKFHKLYGESEDYNSSQQFQSFIFSTIRKTIRDVQGYYRRHTIIMPPLAEVNDQIIKKIISAPQATGLRCKIVAFALHLKRRQRTQRKGDGLQDFNVKDLRIDQLKDVINSVSSFVGQLIRENCVELTRKQN